MSEPNHAALAALALDLLADLRFTGFRAPEEDGFNEDSHMSGADVIEMMQVYYEALKRAAGTE